MTKLMFSNAKMTTDSLARVDGWVGTDANGSRTWIKGCSKSIAFQMAKNNQWQSCRPYQSTREGYLIQV